MSAWLLVVLGVAGAAVCPWWAHRRGSRSVGCSPRPAEPPRSELDEVRARQLELNARLRAFER
jgi:hypothetical protein